MDFGHPFGLDLWLLGDALPTESIVEKLLIDIRSADSTTIDQDTTTYLTLATSNNANMSSACKLSSKYAVFAYQNAADNHGILELVHLAGKTTVASIRH